MAVVDILYQTNVRSIIQIMPDSVCKTPASEPFVSIDSLFKFDLEDVVIVIRAGAVSNKKVFYKTVNHLSQIQNKKHLHFFIEDLFTVSDSPPEIDFISKISKSINVPYTIYHCEKNNFTKYFDWYVADSIISLKDIPEISTNFSKKICCFNRRYTDYRYLASAFLSNYINHVSLTQHYSLSSVENCSIDIDRLNYILNIKTGLGILRSRGKNSDHTVPIDIDYTSQKSSSKLIAITQDSFCSLVTESKFRSTIPNFSEKTLRAVISGRPFVLLAPTGTLQLLRDLGFKTFSRYWDESYDLETDSTKRFEKVMFVVKDILEKENLDIEPMLSVLKHNQEQLKSIPRQMFELLKN